MTLEASVLGDRAVRVTPQGYEVDIHLAWYRSLPLSCVEDISVTVAGENTTRDDLRVLRDGRSFSLAELADKVDEEWFVQDSLTVAVPASSPAAKGSEVDVQVTVVTRIPYIIIGPQTALVKPTRVNRRVVVQ